MANTFKLKRSAVAAKVPSTGDLQLGELALNTYDGKLYTKKDDGTASVVEIGAAGAGATGPQGATGVAGTAGVTGATGPQGATGVSSTSFTYSSSAPVSPSAGDEWLDSTSGILYTYVNDGNSSAWVELGPFGAESISPTIAAMIF